MNCIVEFCGGTGQPSLGLCERHLKRWHKSGEPVGGALDKWIVAERELVLDVCPTPYPLALEIVRRASEVMEWPDGVGLRSPLILEPSAGDGVFVRAARKVWPNAEITAIEIRAEMRSALLAAGANDVLIGDMIPLTTVSALENDLVIGNPPFNEAEFHIHHLLKHMKDGAHLAFLLRVGFYGSLERRMFWEKYPEKYFAPIIPRPSFKLNKHGKIGTDSQEYGLFVWQKGWTGPSIRLPHIVWSKSKAKVVEAKPAPPAEAVPDLE